jgi:hypothetical protein
MAASESEQEVEIGSVDGSSLDGPFEEQESEVKTRPSNVSLDDVIVTSHKSEAKEEAAGAGSAAPKAQAPSRGLKPETFASMVLETFHSVGPRCCEISPSLVLSEPAM